MKVTLARLFAPIVAAALTACSLTPAAGSPRPGSDASPAASSSAGISQTDFQREFGLEQRTFTDSGESRYWILKPGFQLVLTSPNSKLTIDVTTMTRRIGNVTTRVVVEHLEENGQVKEIATNFFAIDPKTGDIFYFGEEVDDYAGGKVIGHGGSWLAFSNGAKPGIVMPGDPQVGMKYYQEVAPGVAMDRAEVMSTTTRCSVPAGSFENCLVTRETTPLEPSVVEEKVYAPGIGLVQDSGLKLVSYGMKK